MECCPKDVRRFARSPIRPFGLSTTRTFSLCSPASNGRVAERLKAPDSKSSTFPSKIHFSEGRVVQFVQQNAACA